MTPPPEKPRRKGKPLGKIKRSTVDTIILAIAMELRDDMTLMRNRCDQLLAALNTETKDE